MYIIDQLKSSNIHVSHASFVKFGSIKIDNFDRRTIIINTDIWSGSGLKININFGQTVRLDKFHYLIRDVSSEVKAVTSYSYLLSGRNSWNKVDIGLEMTDINIITTQGRRLLGTESRYYEFLIDAQPLL